MTMEAWSPTVKPNTTFSHPWTAANLQESFRVVTARGESPAQAEGGLLIVPLESGRTEVTLTG